MYFFWRTILDCYLRPARKLISGTVAPINGPSFAQALSPMDCQVKYIFFCFKLIVTCQNKTVKIIRQSVKEQKTASSLSTKPLE